MNWLLILLVAVVIAFIGFQYLARKMKKRWSEKDLKYFRLAWGNIRAKTDPVHRLLEADKLFDHMLKKKGYTGSLGEKLKRHGNQFSDLDAVWRAHKLRNKLAHELDFKLSVAQVDGALRAFQKAFEDLGLNG